MSMDTSFGMIGRRFGLSAKRPVYPSAGYERADATASLANSGSAGNPGSFHQLLTERLLPAQRAASQNRAHPLLSGPELFALSQRIKLQLTDSLISAFSEDESDNSPPNPMMGSLYDLFPKPIPKEPSPSTNQREPSEKDTLAPQELAGIINRAAATYDMDPDLITGVIHAESSFNPNAQSPKGAMGLMQLMPQTANELGVTDPFDPVDNIMGGTRYLKNLMDRYEGNMSLALAAYNWGMGNLESRGEKLPTETKNYIRKITDYYRERKTATG